MMIENAKSIESCVSGNSAFKASKNINNIGSTKHLLKSEAFHNYEVGNNNW